MALGNLSQKGSINWAKKIEYWHDLEVREGKIRAEWGGRKGRKE